MRFMWREALVAAFVGLVLGGLSELYLGVRRSHHAFLFPGEIALLTALVFGGIGFLTGETFREWVIDWWFWPRR